MHNFNIQIPTAWGLKFKKIFLLPCDFQIPIIADEIYAGMVYHDAEFHSFCKLAHRIPVIHVGGLAKRFLVPGWRLGWTIVHDPTNIFKNKLTIGIVKMSTRLGKQKFESIVDNN